MIRLESVAFDIYSAKGSGINLHLSAGDTAVILGPHNSGKSVIIKICLGMIPLTRGKAILDGGDIAVLKKRGQVAILQEIGYVPKGPSLLDNLTVAGNIGLPLMYHDGATYKEMLEKIRPTLIKFGLENVAEKFPSDISRNETRMTQMARAIIQKPKLLFIHEPTAGDLDPDGFLQVVRHIKDAQKEGTTILITTSSSSLAATCGKNIYIFLEEKLFSLADAGKSQSPAVIEYLQSLENYSKEQNQDYIQFFRRRRVAE